MELGSTVTLTYKGTLDDGTVFGYADVEHPMTFQTGMDQAIDGFEAAIMEMNEVGEKKSFRVGEYDAYGEYLDNFTTVVPKEQIPVGDLHIGKRVYMAGTDDSAPTPATVIEITPHEVTFDMNHPLAGQALNFEVEILGIEPPPENFVSAAELARRYGGGETIMGGRQGEDFR